MGNFFPGTTQLGGRAAKNRGDGGVTLNRYCCVMGNERGTPVTEVEEPTTYTVAVLWADESFNYTPTPDGQWMRAEDARAWVTAAAAERAAHADCRCNELEAMAIIDGKYESVAIDGQLLERPDVTRREALQDAAEAVKDALARRGSQDSWLDYSECAVAAIEALDGAR
jgi:hypothetical protein